MSDPILVPDRIAAGPPAGSVPAGRGYPPLTRLSSVIARYGNLPKPGSGSTLMRWRAFAEVAAQDMTLIKLFEAHVDALAILAELGVPSALGRAAADDRSIWAVWAAEPPDARVEAVVDAVGQLRLRGRKSWCSGARGMTHALVSCWTPNGDAMLAAVDLRQPSVRITVDGWHAVGMAATESVDVIFDDVVAYQVGMPGDYVGRPGFWHGGAGIAACWFGGLQPIADAMRRTVARRGDALNQAALGRVDRAMASARALLIAAGKEIDAWPHRDARVLALRTRCAVEDTVRIVLEQAAGVLGAGPLCRDENMARRFADLPVFVRQSHGDRDLAAIGKHIAETVEGDDPWRL